MLIYNPAHDIYHTMFRILLLSSQIVESIEIDKLKILDFYYVYPMELLNIKKPKGFKTYEKFLRAEINNYDRVINPKRVFYKMNSIQYQAMKVLVAYGHFDSENFENGMVKVTEKPLGKDFQTLIDKSTEANMNLIMLLTGPIAEIDLYGHLGLKERTGLIEFRYDTI